MVRCVFVGVKTEAGSACERARFLWVLFVEFFCHSQLRVVWELLRITEWSRLEGTSVVTQSNPLPKQGHPEQAAQDLVQAGLEHLQRRLHSLPGQPGPVLHHPQREVLPHVQTELPVLQFVPIVPCPVTGHYWKELGPTFLTPTLQIFVSISLALQLPAVWCDGSRGKLSGWAVCDWWSQRQFIHVSNSGPFLDRKHPVPCGSRSGRSGSTWSANGSAPWHLPWSHSAEPSTLVPCSEEALPSPWTPLETVCWQQSSPVPAHFWWCEIVCWSLLQSADPLRWQCCGRGVEQDFPENCDIGSYFPAPSVGYTVWGVPDADVKACPYSSWWPGLFLEN